MDDQDPWATPNPQSPSIGTEDRDSLSDTDSFGPFADSDEDAQLINNNNNNNQDPLAGMDTTLFQDDPASDLESQDVSNPHVPPVPRDWAVAIEVNDLLSDFNIAIKDYYKGDTMNTISASNLAPRGGSLSIITGSDGPLTHAMFIVKLRHEMPSQPKWDKMTMCYMDPRAVTEELITYVTAWKSETHIAQFLVPYTLYQCLATRAAYTLISRATVPSAIPPSPPPMTSYRDYQDSSASSSSSSSSSHSGPELYIVVIGSVRDQEGLFFSHFNNDPDPTDGFGRTNSGQSYRLVSIHEWTINVFLPGLPEMLNAFRDFLAGRIGHLDLLPRLNGVIFLLDGLALGTIAPTPSPTNNCPMPQAPGYPDLSWISSTGPVDLGTLGVGVFSRGWRQACRDRKAAGFLPESPILHRSRQDDLVDAMKAVLRPFEHQGRTLVDGVWDGDQAGAKAAVEMVLSAALP